MFKFKQYDFKRYNITLIIIVLILGLIGAYLIKQAKPELYVKHIAGIGAGLFLAFIVSLIDYHFICSFYIVLYLINLVLLVLVKVMGETKNDSQRWLNIGFSFQPSELSKIILILFLAMFFSLLRHKINSYYVILLTIILTAIPVYLIFDQPNLSTSLVILFIIAMMIFAAGLSWKIILPVILIGLPLFFGVLWYVQQDYQVLLKDYQQKRVLSILNKEQDTYSDLMFQQDTSVLSIGSGQLYGKVFDKDEMRGYEHLPISESDFIFAVAGEELGFIGCCIILALYGVIIYICLVTARKAPDYMGMLIAVGMASMFMFQVFVNIGVATSFLPNTGIPLPFLSSGLSSLISGMIAVGIILNIRLQPGRVRNERKEA